MNSLHHAVRCMLIVFRSLWLCLFAVLSTLLVNLVLGAVPQGRELLIMISEDAARDPGAGGSWERGWLLISATMLAAILLALVVWHSSRILLGYRFPADRFHMVLEEPGEGFQSWLRAHLPRHLGMLCMLPIAFYFAIAYRHAEPINTLLLWFTQIGLYSLVVDIPAGTLRVRRYVHWLLILLAAYLFLHYFYLHPDAIDPARAYGINIVVLTILMLCLLALFLREWDRIASRYDLQRARKVVQILFMATVAALSFLTWYGLESAAEKVWQEVLAFLALANGFYGFAYWRRRRFPKFFQRISGGIAQAGEQFSEIGGLTKSAMTVALATSWILFFIIVLNPIAVGAKLGSVALLLLAAASWAAFGCIALVLVPKAYGWPSLVWLPALLLVVASAWRGDVHGLRDVEFGTQPDARLPVAEHFQQWRRHAGLKPGEPVFVVAAEGGGIRAAYWTAASLAAADDATCGEFGRHVYAISGVSGGAVGAAAYVALRDNARHHAAWSRSCNAPNRLQTRWDRLEAVTRMLKKDFLSPVVASMLFPDMVQNFTPWRWPYIRGDRGVTLEQGWERAAAESFDVNRDFEKPFAALYGDGKRVDLPSLIINATSVDDGHRVFTSNLRLSSLDAYDLMHPLFKTAGMRVSTAVHNSARFSFVSPAGTVYARRPGAPKSPAAPVPAPAWQQYLAGRIVDGGYLDNSGAIAAREVVATLKTLAGNDNPIVVILISNNTEEPPICGGTPSVVLAEHDVPGVSELTAPFETFWNARSARASLAKRELAHLTAPNDLCGDTILDWNLYQSGLRSSFQKIGYNRNMVENVIERYPLGWALSSLSTYGLDHEAKTVGSTLPYFREAIRE